MKIDTNTPVSVLCFELKQISDFASEKDGAMLFEAADRLELIDVENDDLRVAVEKFKRELAWWKARADKAFLHIQILEEAGDAVVSEPCEYTFEQWIQAKEAKP